MPPFTVAANDSWVLQVATMASGSGDISDSVCITVEPLPTEKSLLAVPDGEPAEDLHVTLAFMVGGVSELGDEGRMAISTVLAQIASETSPFTGEVAGIGWFKSADTITLALIDAEGLAALRVEISNRLAEAGYQLDLTHDFVPHLTLAYAPVMADDRAGMPLSFNEIRLRWGSDVLAFDLMGIPQAPEAPLVESPGEVAPTTDEAPITEAAPITDEAPIPEAAPMPNEEALVADYEIAENHPACMGSPDGPVALLDEAGDLVSCHMTWDEAEMKATDPVVVDAPVVGEPLSPVIVAAVAAVVAERKMARQFDLDMTDMAPADETAPGSPDEEMGSDLSTMSDNELAMEIARRIAEEAVGEGEDPTAVQDMILAEVTAALAEVMADAIEDRGEAPEDAPPAEPASGAVATRSPSTAVADRAARRRVARLVAKSKRAVVLAAAEVDEIVAAAPVPGPSPEAPGLFEFESVLTVEGMPSGDGRFITEGCLTWRNLPLPLMLQTVNAPGHDGSVFCGWISEIERSGHTIMGRGNFAAGAAGDAARQILGDPSSAGKFGVSVDIDSVTVVFADPSGAELSPDEAVEAKMFGAENIVEMMVSGRIMGATMTPFPAFQEAFVYLLSPIDDRQPLDQTPALVASISGDLWRSTVSLNFSINGSTSTEALVASASGPDPDAPPAAWFASQPMDEPISFSVGADGRCYGLVAEWGTCHIGNSRRCVQVPRSNDFRSFYTGKRIITREGTALAVGPIIMDTVHPNLLAQASDAQAFYAHTGCAVADVRLFTNEFGIVAAGAIRPDATPTQIRRLRGSDISPDWRPMSGEHKLVSLLAVNTSGFLVEGIAASAGRFQPWGVLDTVSGEVGALVAAGAIHQDHQDPASMREALSALQAEIGDLRARFDVQDEVSRRLSRLEAVDSLFERFVPEAEAEAGGCDATFASEDGGGKRFVDDGVGLILQPSPDSPAVRPAGT